MQRSTRLLRPAVVAMAFLWLAGGISYASGPAALSVAGGFQRDDGSVSDRSSSAGTPSLVLGSLAGDPNKLVPWVAFEQHHTSDAQDIFAKTFNAATNQWVLRGADRNGGSLNFDRSVEAEHPSIDFAGPLVNGQRTVPWAAWYEPVKAFGGKNNIFASKFVKTASEEFWQLAGLDRSSNGAGITSLNIHTNQEAENPALAGGSAQAGATTTVPWVAWEEDSAVNGKRQIFVSRAQANAGATGGFQWVPTGKIRLGTDEPTINVDPQRDGVEPDITFSGPGNTVPWTVWYEKGGGRPERVFAAKAVADSTAGVVGGFRWDIQPDCAGNEVACALNRNAAYDAEDPKIASGTLKTEDSTKPKPWITWVESDGAHTQVFVSRFNGTTFVPVGGSLNVLPQDDTAAPDIFFVGHVPFVSFVETIGSRKVLLVRHLTNVDTGFWALDTSLHGLNVSRSEPADLPSLGGNGYEPFVAWQEGGQEQAVFEAHRLPAGPAWGNVAPEVLAPQLGTSQTITITGNHVNGSANIKQIDYAVNTLGTYAAETALVRYVAPSDPTQPASAGTLALFDPATNQFSPPAQVGADTVQETSAVKLLVAQSAATDSGPDGVAVILTLTIQFKAPATGLMTQNLRIISRDGSDTGLFQIAAPEQVFLPLVTH